MGGQLSKWQPRGARRNPEAAGSGPEAGDTTGQYQPTGDVFNDILRSCELTNKQRREQLEWIKKRYGESYQKRFGTKSVDEVVKENQMISATLPPSSSLIRYTYYDLSTGQKREQGSREGNRQLFELFKTVLYSDTMARKEKKVFFKRVQETHPALFKDFVLGAENNFDGYETSEPDAFRGVSGVGPGGDAGSSHHVDDVVGENKKVASASALEIE